MEEYFAVICFPCRFDKVCFFSRKMAFLLNNLNVIDDNMMYVNNWFRFFAFTTTKTERIKYLYIE